MELDQEVRQILRDIKGQTVTLSNRGGSCHLGMAQGESSCHVHVAKHGVSVVAQAGVVRPTLRA